MRDAQIEQYRRTARRQSERRLEALACLGESPGFKMLDALEKIYACLLKCGVHGLFVKAFGGVRHTATAGECFAMRG